MESNRYPLWVNSADNVSRTIVGEALRLYPDIVIAEISADPETCAARIAARGWETAANAVARSRRSMPPLPEALFTYRIRNNGRLEDAGDDFCRLLAGEIDVIHNYGLAF